VAALLSADGKPLSTEQVRIWVDNLRASLKRKKAGEDKQSEPNDKEQENMTPYYSVDVRKGT
jgi:hypothetical protein